MVRWAFAIGGSFLFTWLLCSWFPSINIVLLRFEKFPMPLTLPMVLFVGFTWLGVKAGK